MPLMDSLLNLHRVDAQVRGLRSRLDSAERYLAQQERQLAEIEGRVDERETRRRHLKARIANLETEAAGLDQQIEKYRGDLNNAANTKQYQAVLTEVETVKKRRRELEDETLTEMEAVEALEAELSGLETDRLERVKVRDVALGRRDERQAEVGDRLTELEAEREQAAAAVPGDSLATFDRVAEIHDGEAMAPVLEISRRHREYACGECNIHLPFETVAVLMGSVSNVVQCTSCHRILYMQDEVRGALTPK